MAEESNKRHFLFEMTDPYTGNRYKFEQDIDDYDGSIETELEYLLEQFKCFLKAAGFCEMSTDRLQYLDDDEFRYVLKKYNLWTSEHEKYFGGNKDE